MGLSVRPARREDLSAIVTIYNHYVVHSPATFDTRPASVEDRGTWFEEHAPEGRHRLFVAEEDGGHVVGWASTSPFRPRPAYDTTVETSVYCDARQLHQGVGTRLYRELFRALEGEDIERLVAGVSLPNPGSLRLHERFGFSRVGTFTRVGRKFGTYWDVAWFERPLHLEGGTAPTPG